ncbi:MAG: hypothetical protein JSV37_14630 [Anaerolineaceae bacterium]|nr:MAG: hypothetical protein JSV37_14630 [Anaerolineaceae bacterium]
MTDGSACYSDRKLEYETIFEVKGLKMNTISKRQKIFRRVFFVISAGALVSAGIFIEKIILTEVAWMDYLSAAVFGAIGLGISAYSFFCLSANQ